MPHCTIFYIIDYTLHANMLYCIPRTTYEIFWAPRDSALKKVGAHARARRNFLGLHHSPRHSQHSLKQPFFGPMVS